MAGCNICLDKSCDGEQQLPEVERFVISADSWNRDRAIVPCKVRFAFNSVVGDSFEMCTVQCVRYNVSVLKRSSKTFLKGDWSLFVDHHDLKSGDNVLMSYKPHVGSFNCVPMAPDGDVRISALNEAEYNNQIFSGTSFTLRMSEITDDEMKRLLSIVKWSKRWTMTPLVHRLTTTDAERFALKLKKSLIDKLNLEPAVTIQFKVYGGEPCDGHDVRYKIMTDGRALCQWKEVVEDHGFAVGQLMVCPAVMYEDDPVVIVWKV
ncbi:hypothetical protein EJB05_31612, partial [Eragrostis curvula]